MSELTGARANKLLLVRDMNDADFTENGEFISLKYKAVKHNVVGVPPIGVASAIAPLNGTSYPAGTTFAVVPSSLNNVAVTINPDGTHSVTPSDAALTAGGWSYSYTATLPDGTVVTSPVSWTTPSTGAAQPCATGTVSATRISPTDALAVCESGFTVYKHIAAYPEVVAGDASVVVTPVANAITGGTTYQTRVATPVLQPPLMSLVGTVLTLTGSTGTTSSVDLTALADTNTVYSFTREPNGDILVEARDKAGAVLSTQTLASPDTDNQVVTSSDNSLKVNATTLANGQVDYDLIKPILTPNHIVTTALPVSVPSLIAPNNGNEHPAGTTYALVPGSSVEVAVVLNANGTHTVTPTANTCTAGGWSYQYEATAPNGTKSTGTVTGIVDNALVDSNFYTKQAAGSVINLAITTDTGAPWEVAWGDGTVQSGNASGATRISHTYAAAYAGNVIVRVPKCAVITEMRSTVGAWHFNIANSPAGLTYQLIQGQNTVFGDIANSPSGLTYQNIQGQNTLSGDIANSPSGLTYQDIQGQNTVSGDIANSPAGLTVQVIQGQNTVSGDIANAPAGLTYMSIAGQNTLSGNIASSPSGLTYMAIIGQNTLSGNIANSPSGLTYQNIQGQNTLSGNIANSPSGLTYQNIQGQNTVSGDIANSPSGLTYQVIQGQNTLTMATTTWPAVTSGFRYFRIHGAAKTQAMVNNMLVALTNVTSWASEKTVDVAGTNAAPSAIGTAAKATILANGATNVYTN